MSAERADREEAGPETILLVDDEDVVRDFARVVLEREGYRVLVARSGRDAIRIASRHSGRIHLMLADVVMPDVGGPETWRRLSAVRPEMKVLFLTGYASPEQAPGEAPADGAAYLQKPFTMESLAKKAREVLDQSTPKGH